MRIFLVMLSILLGSVVTFADVSEYNRFINPYQVNISLPSKDVDSEEGVEVRTVSPYEQYSDDDVDRLKKIGKETIYNIQNTETNYDNWFFRRTFL